MKALFLIFHGFNPSNGISKKISYQVNALKQCGNDVHLCYMDETGTKKRIIDDNNNQFYVSEYLAHCKCTGINTVVDNPCVS